MIIRPQGGAYSRPGMRFIGEVGDSSTSVRLIPFSFNTEQNYVLLFQHLTMQVIKDGAFVAGFELETPYTDDQLSRLKYTQNADVMTITHQSHPPSNLTRLADDDWSLDVIDYTHTSQKPRIGVTHTTLITDITVINSYTIELTTSASYDFIEGDELYFFKGTGTSWDGVDGTLQYELGAHDFIVSSLESSTVFRISTDFDTTGLTDNGVYGVCRNQTLDATVGTGSGDQIRTYKYRVTSVDKYGTESVASTSAVIYDSYNMTDSYGIKINIDNSGGFVSEIEYFRIYKNTSDGTIYGWIADVEYNASNTYYTDFNVAPDYSDLPPAERTPFDDENYPAAVNYYQQRQVFANTYSQPQTIFTTQTGYYDSLRVHNPLRDDDALTFTIAANRVNEVRHLISLDALIPLTSGGEWVVTEGQDQVLKPSTLGVRIKSYNGASWVEPAIIDDTVVYVQEKGNRIRDLKYSVADNIYQGNDISIMAEHLFEDNQITEMVYADEPYGVLWCIRDDGVLLGMTYNRDQNVWAWHQHHTDGLFESITTIGEDDRDAVYVCVNRTIEGVTKRYIERIEKRITNDVTDCFYVDSGLSYNGSPVSTVSGLDHLEGQTVVALADGVVIKDLIVESGSVSLGDDYSKVHVGLPYTPRMETLQVDIPSMEQSLKGKSVNIASLYIDIEKSRGMFAGVVGEEMMEVTPREVSYDYSAPPLNTWTETLNIQPQWSNGRDSSSNIAIEQRDPLPLAILSITAEVDIG